MYDSRHASILKVTTEVKGKCKTARESFRLMRSGCKAMDGVFRILVRYPEGYVARRVGGLIGEFCLWVVQRLMMGILGE